MQKIQIVSRKYDGSLRDEYEAYLYAFNHAEQVALYQRIQTENI